MQVALSTVAIGTSACNRSSPSTIAPNQILEAGPPSGSILGDDGLNLSLGSRGRDTQVGVSLGVNAYLWRGALETLSFMPLSSADPFGGIIITDWYSSSISTEERFKAIAYILSKDLRSDGIKVALFRQVLQKSQWIDTTVSAATVTEIEGKILDRAKRLRDVRVSE
jgi:hypothetical protein